MELDLFTTTNPCVGIWVKYDQPIRFDPVELEFWHTHLGQLREASVRRGHAEAILENVPALAETEYFSWIHVHGPFQFGMLNSAEGLRIFLSASEENLLLYRLRWM